MNRQGRNIWWTASLFLLLVPGCGDSNELPEGNKSKVDVVGNRTTVDPEHSPELQPAPAGAVSRPNSAEAAVRAVIDGLKNHNPRAVWDFLPTGYQSDLNEIVHAFAEKGESESWSGLFSRGRRTVELLKTRKEYFLSYPRLRQLNNLKLDELERNWDPTLELFATLLASDIADLEKLKTIDVGPFLERTGGRVMTQLAELSKSLPNDPFNTQLAGRLSELKVEKLHSAGDSASLRLSPADPAQSPTEVDFVRVEGKWIPQSLAESWEPGIEEAKRKIASISTAGWDEKRAGAAALFGQIDGVLLGLEQAETAEEFHRQLDAVFFMFGMMFGDPGITEPNSEGQSLSAESENDSVESSVTVVIAGRLGEKRVDDLCARLNAIVRNENLALAEMPLFVEGKTRIRVSPVGNVSAYAKRIDFARVVTVDAESRTITIEIDSHPVELKRNPDTGK